MRYGPNGHRATQRNRPAAPPALHWLPGYLQALRNENNKRKKTAAERAARSKSLPPSCPAQRSAGAARNFAVAEICGHLTRETPWPYKKRPLHPVLI